MICDCPTVYYLARQDGGSSHSMEQHGQDLVRSSCDGPGEQQEANVLTHVFVLYQAPGGSTLLDHWGNRAAVPFSPMDGTKFRTGELFFGKHVGMWVLSRYSLSDRSSWF